MLPETPLELRVGMIFGLGDVGTVLVDKIEGLCRERLGGIPILGLVSLRPDFGSSEPALGVRREVPARWHVSLPMAGAARMSSAPPDPASSGVDPALVRRSGCEAIQRWGVELQNLIDKVVAEVQNADTITTARSRSDAKVHIDETNVEVFVVAALDEPFASGAFLDLAYLLDHVLGFAGGGSYQYHISGILFLPNYQREGAVTGIREADTYAALKELDHYASQRHYVSESRPAFTTDRPPFNRSCFLVETTNQVPRALPRLEQISSMTAEWLYRYLTSPISLSLRTHSIDYANRTSQGRAITFGGLGVASLVLPMDAAIDACGARLGHEIVGSYIRRHLSKQEQNDLWGQAETYAGSPITDTLDAGLRSMDAVAHFADIDPRYFDNIDFWDYRGLRDRLIGMVSDEKINRVLPGIRDDARKKAEEALRGLRENLPRYVDEMINRTPSGGIDRAHTFLEKLKGTMVDRERAAKDQASRAHRLETSVGDDIARSRAEYQSATKMFTPQALVGLLVGLIVFVGLLVYAGSVFFRLLPDLELEVLGGRLLLFHGWNLVAGILLILVQLAVLAATVATAQVWATSSKLQYISHHRARLDHSLRKVIEDLRARFFQEMQKVGDDQIIRLTRFRDHAEELEEGLKAEVEKPRPLFGALHFPLEESVLQPEDLETYYQEVTKKEPLDDFVGDLMRQYGPLTDWANRALDTLVEQIAGFGRQRMEVLRRRKNAEQNLIGHLGGSEVPDISRLDVVAQERLRASAQPGERTSYGLPPLPADKQAALRQQADELFKRADPFLRYDATNIQQAPDKLTLLGTHTQEEEATYLNRVVKEHFGKVQTVTTTDPHTLVALSVIHGLPLYALGMAKRYRANYDEHYRDKPLHTRRDHVALPDLFPLPADVLEPRMALALGCALKARGSREPIVALDPATGYYFVHSQPGHPSVTIPLGKDKLEACIQLQRSAEDLLRLSRLIDDEVLRRAASSGTGPRNKTAITALRRYMADNAGTLEEWETKLIERYIQRLE